MTSKGIFGFREVDETIFPNLFMPPLIHFFIFIKFLNPLPSHFVDVVLYVHLTLSLIAIIYFNQHYKFL